VSGRSTAFVAPIGAGALTALALGVYSSSHDPTGRDFVLAGFESTASWKSALASIALALFVTQLSLGLRITGRIGPRRPAPAWAPDLHRLVSTLAFGLSLPVVFHCLWALGYEGGADRVGFHSLLGCVAYGAYVANALSERVGGRPPGAVPLGGAFVAIAMLATWWTSALVHYAGTAA